VDVYVNSYFSLLDIKNSKNTAILIVAYTSDLVYTSNTKDIYKIVDIFITNNSGKDLYAKISMVVYNGNLNIFDIDGVTIRCRNNTTPTNLYKKLSVL
jgi:hypothetical protein